ncbi:Bromodomain-containing protein 9 [Heterocephalus glaber]|uniref:Bromodomain-containing protein 9 n=1 Tax=Heterocephalus glaber TaxID=10181 RepID=G5BPH6_HETGA|nr:Bromodomain-containing protein 9 [Heterocephalus glaber]
MQCFCLFADYADAPLEKPLKLVLKVGGSEVTELSGSGHDSSYYDDRSDHERERHREKKKKKKKKAEKEKHLDDEERRKRKEEKKRKREKEHCDTEGEAEDFDPGKKVEVEPPPDRPVRACRTQPGKSLPWSQTCTALGSIAWAISLPAPVSPGPGVLLLLTCGEECHCLVPPLPVKIIGMVNSSTQWVDPGPVDKEAENESTPIQQLLEHFLRQLQRKDPHGFFAFPVTDAIAPGYSMIIKHPMDFGTMKDKIIANEYKSVTEFKADFKLMCDNAMTYNRPDTVYYKLAKKILHAGFKMMSKDMDFSQQAALLGSEDMAVEEPVPEVVPVQVETAKKSKKPSREVISCVFEPEGNACSLTDSTAEEHVLALVEHAADEARDRINRFLPGGKMGYLKKLGDGSLLYSVVNVAEPDADEEETHPVDLSSLSSKLLPGFTTLGFKDERRNKVTFLSSATTGLSMQNNSVFGDLKSDEMELLYSAYGDETGVQCALSLQEFVKDAGSYSKKMVDDLLDQIAGGDHSRMLLQLRQRRNVPVRAADEVKVGDSLGDSGGSVLDFMSMKSYSDVSLDISMLSSLGKMKKDLDHDDGHLNLDETAKLLQDLHEAQAERGGSRPSSNLSSLSNASEREQHPPDRPHGGNGSVKNPPSGGGVRTDAWSPEEAVMDPWPAPSARDQHGCPRQRPELGHTFSRYALALLLCGSATHTPPLSHHRSRAPGAAVLESRAALARPQQDRGWGSQTETAVFRSRSRGQEPLPL